MSELPDPNGYGDDVSARFLRDLADSLPEAWNLSIPRLRFYADRLDARTAVAAPPEGTELEQRVAELLAADADMRAARDRWSAAVHGIFDTGNERIRSWNEDDIKNTVHVAVLASGHEPFESLVRVLERDGYWLARAAGATEEPGLAR